MTNDVRRKQMASGKLACRLKKQCRIQCEHVEGGTQENGSAFACEVLSSELPPVTIGINF